MLGKLHVIKAGPLTLLHDLGRYGFSHFGITPSGPLDEYAYSWANHLLANPVNCATLEITLGPAEFLYAATRTGDCLWRSQCHARRSPHRQLEPILCQARTNAALWFTTQRATRLSCSSRWVYGLSTTGLCIYPCSARLRGTNVARAGAANG